MRSKAQQKAPIQVEMYLRHEGRDDEVVSAVVQVGWSDCSRWHGKQMVHRLIGMRKDASLAETLP